MTVRSLIESVKALLGVPTDDTFHGNANIIDWLHEGAVILFPFLPEAKLTSTHLRTEIYPFALPYPGNYWYGTVPASFLEVKNIEVEQGSNSNIWHNTELLDYNTFSNSISKTNILGITNPSDFRSAKWGSKIFLYPLPNGRVKLNYFRYPDKVTNELAEADYPDFIIPAIKDYAVSRGKAKEPNGQAEVISYYNKFQAVLNQFMGLQQKEELKR